MGYTVLEKDATPESLNNKPRWMACASFAVGILVITLSAITVGAFIGYTYCYIEHRTGFTTAEQLAESDLQIFRMPIVESEEVKYNRSINGALLTRILRFSHVFIDYDLPWPNEDTTSDSVTPF